MTWRRPFFMLLLAWTSPAVAMPWAVPDEQAASSLRQALDDLWPEQDVEIVVGTLAEGTFGLQHTGDELTWIRPEGVYVRSVGEDPYTAVATARSWYRSFTWSEDGLPAPPVEPIPTPTPAPAPDVMEPTAEAPLVDVTVGAGFLDALRREEALGGVSVTAAVRWKAFGASLYGVVATRSATQVSPLEWVVLDRMVNTASISTTEPVFTRTSERYGAGVAVDWDFGLRRAAGGRRVWVTPLVEVGAELRRNVLRTLAAESSDTLGEPSVTLGETGVVAGATVGVGGQVALGRVRLRLRANATSGHDAVDTTVTPRLFVDCLFRLSR